MLLILAVLFRLFLALGPWHPDLGNHLDWGIKFWEIGPKNFYENLFWRVSWANQPPGTIYIFAVMAKVYQIIFSIAWWLNLKIPAFPSILIPFLEGKLHIALVKMPAILADFGMGFLIYKFLKEFRNERMGKIGALIFLFNPVIWYNSAVWGQTDAIINFFGLWSIYLFSRKKPLWATFVFLFSLYFKGSLLIFLPIILILLWQSKEDWWKKVLVVLVTPPVLAYLSFPFVKWMSPIPWMYHLYRDRVFGHQGNMLSANAFNLWAVIFGIDFSLNDQGKFLYLTFKNWGQLLFGGSVLLPLLALWRQKKFNLVMTSWVLFLVSLFSFLFLTNMHERYLYPAIPYLTLLVFLLPSWKFFYGFFSALFFLNLYHLWYIPDILGLRLLFTPFTVKFFSVANLILGGWFFLRFLRFKKV